MDPDLPLDVPPDTRPPPHPVAGGSRVLARKYRPRTFDALMGQAALVRTLTNALRSGRLHHAYMLTGVRGVGKTTTARIIARAFNCSGPDGQGAPTCTPCDQCDNCLAILGDRHIDVLEMDAASNTGVDNIREIIDSARLAPMRARFRIFIIDEVHMLSKGAFNALLKTLEEPPPHVKFIFATTEIRKVPVTVLSRCQRFDLKRLDTNTLVSLFTNVAAAEAQEVTADALAIIARAADGSARDGLSLLDQAMALADGTVTAAVVSDMLGLADRQQILDLLEAALTGQPDTALTVMDRLMQVGAEPSMVIHDLLECVHTLTRLLVVPNLATDTTIPEAERTRGLALAKRLTIPALARAWQILLKGHGEVQLAVLPRQAAEMLIVRLAYASGLDTPGDLVQRLSEPAKSQPANAATTPANPHPPSAPRLLATSSHALAISPVEEPMAPPPVAAPLVAVAAAPEVAAPLADPQDFEEMVALFAERREGMLAAHLRRSAHLVRFQPGAVEFRLAPGAPADLANQVARHLDIWTGRRWIVSLASTGGGPTLRQAEEAETLAIEQEAARHPVVQTILENFPGAKVTVRLVPNNSEQTEAIDLDLKPEETEPTDDDIDI